MKYFCYKYLISLCRFYYFFLDYQKLRYLFKNVSITAVALETKNLHVQCQISFQFIIRMKIDTHSHLITFLVPNSGIGIVLFKNNSWNVKLRCWKSTLDVRLFLIRRRQLGISCENRNVCYNVGGIIKHIMRHQKFHGFESRGYFFLQKTYLFYQLWFQLNYPLCYKRWKQLVDLRYTLH